MREYVKDTLEIVGLTLLVVAVFIVFLGITVGFGYLVGMVMAIIPLFPSLLGVEDNPDIIPKVTAWLAVAGMFVGGGSSAKRKAKEKV